MQCDQFENRLNDVLDRRDDPSRDNSLMAHMAGCDDCRRMSAAYAMLTDGAAALRNTAILPPIERAAERRSLCAAVAPLLVTAAAVAFVFFQSDSGNAPAIKTPATTPAPVATIVPEVVIAAAPTSPKPAASAPAMIDLARSTGRAYVGLIHGTARGVDEAMALATALPTPHQLLEPMLYPEDGLLRRMEDEWVPVADETFDALRQVFQPAGSQSL